MFLVRIAQLLVLLYSAQCAKILAVFPTPAISHQFAFRHLTNELVKRGHEVVVITPNPAFAPGQAPENLTEIDVHDISYAHWEENLHVHDGTKISIIAQLLNLFEKVTSTFEKQVQTPEVQRVLREEGHTFDLIIAEGIVRAVLGLGHLLKIPVIQYSSAGITAVHYNQFGGPLHPIIFPNFLNQRVYDLTWWEKSLELVKAVSFEYLLVTMHEYDHAMVKRNFGEDTPTFDELFEKYVRMMFVNEHPIWAENHPVPPNVVYVGGTHQPAETILPKELEEFLDSSKNGVIYVSFGTSVKTWDVSPEKIIIMTNVLSDLPYDVIWKWDQDEMPGRPKNIKISKWLPQPQLLKHPNVKLFITQGGLQSTDELINAAVPVIGIPMLGDQWYNTEKYVHHKIGLQLDINTLSEEKFRVAVTTVLTDESYKENAIKFRKVMRTYPVHPLDLAVWWTEYVIENGAIHLRSQAFNKSIVTYYEGPLLGTLLAVLASFIVVLGLIVRRVLPLLWGLRMKAKIQ